MSKTRKNMYNEQIQSKAADFEYQRIKLQTDYHTIVVCFIKIHTF